MVDPRESMELPVMYRELSIMVQSAKHPVSKADENSNKVVDVTRGYGELGLASAYTTRIH